MEDKNLNFIKNGNGIKANKNLEINLNKSFKTMKFSIPKRNVSQEICKNMENENSSEKNNDINRELNLANLIKANKSLQKELRIAKNKKEKDKKKIILLRNTINNFISEEDKNKITTQINTNSSILNKKILSKNNITYADLLINAENILEENSELNQEIRQLSKIKNENLELKNKLMDKEQAINEMISINIDLEKKLEIKENKISKLYEKLKDFQKFEEIKLLNESLSKKLKSRNEEIIELNKIIREREKNINDLKCMKYDEKLFIIEQELNEYKLEATKYINEIFKLKSDLKNTKNKLEINNDLLEQNQKIIKENEINTENNINKYNNLKNENNSLKNINNKIKEENNELKNKNIKIKIELNGIKEYYLKCKDELSNISNKLIKVNDEKEKNEIYYLDQISILQKEKNYIEKNMNEIKDKYIFNQNLKNILNKNTEDINNEINISNKYNEKYLIKKYEIAINEINNYNKDNKKLLDLSKKLKNELNLVTEEKNFYIKIINKLIEGNYIDKKYYNFITTIKKSIENFLDIQSLNKNKCDLEQQLSKYEKIMKNMNKKINSEETGKSYEINKNFYNVDDFSDIAKIQNKLMIINDKLNGLYENKVNIKKEIDKF